MIRTLLLTIFLSAISEYCLHAQEPEKLPVPSDADRAAALDQIQTVYKEQYEAAKTDDQKVTLAKKLLSDARATTNKPAARYALLRIAKDIAAGVGHLETSSAAIEELDRHYEVDRLQLEAETLLVVTNAAEIALHYQALAPEFIRLIERALEVDRFDVVGGLADRAEFAARRARKGELKQRMDELLNRFKSQQEAAQQVASARAVLKEKPTDPKANAAVGKYRCFVKGDWSGGIPMLALGDDKELADMAVVTLKKTASSWQLGDRWWDYGDKLPEFQQSQAKRYAVVHYRRALPSLEGFNQTRIERRIEEFAATSPRLGEPFPPALAIFTFDEDSLKTGDDGIVTLFDYSNRNNHGTFRSPVSTEGKLGEAIWFRKPEQINLPTLRKYLVADLDSVSLCCWAYSIDKQSQAIFDVGFFANKCLTLSVAQGRYMFMLRTDMQIPVDDVTKWHHVALVWQGDTATTYLDGKLHETHSLNPFLLNGSTIGGDAAVLGRHAKRTDNPRRFHGALDELGIFAGPLSENQVREIYQRGLIEAVR